MGYQRKVVFQEPVVKACQKGNFLYRVIIKFNFCALEYTFNRFFLESGYHLKGKILEPGEKHFHGHIPVQI